MLGKGAVLHCELVVQLLVRSTCAEKLLFFFAEVRAMLEFVEVLDVVLLGGDVSTLALTAWPGPAP